MTVITIPKNVTKEKELVVITRKQYEEYLRVVPSRRTRVVRVSSGKASDSMAALVRRAIKDYQAGKTSGPFTTVDELVAHLKLSEK